MEENSQKSTDIKNSQGADYRNSGSRGSGQHNDPEGSNTPKMPNFEKMIIYLVIGFLFTANTKQMVVL